MMNLQGLKRRIGTGEVDTVIVACPDVFGRLVGKRFTGRFFLDQVASHGTHGCNYLLAVDMEMEPMDGFKLANWEEGFGDFEMRPDPGGIRLLPWQAGTALVLGDFHDAAGRRVEEAPRAVLRRRLEALSRRKWSAKMASELEFFLYRNSYHEAFESGYRRLTPSSDYRIDYHIMQTARDEEFFRAVRNGMEGAGIRVESSKGEWGRGQHEVNFRHDAPLAMADRHALFKQGLKEMAAQRDLAVSFMAKPSVTEPGNSCHIHASLWRGDRNLFWNGSAKGGSKLFRQFLGGLLKYSRELSYFFAPTINSYKRYQAGSWAPTKMAWAGDNRTVGFRVVGRGGGFRVENRMPGADANPYLAFAAMLAAGEAGIAEGLDCGEEYRGNAYVDETLPALPTHLREAIDLLDGSEMARRTLGDAVVDFYVHTGRLELRAFDGAVTDWERVRYFERI